MERIFDKDFLFNWTVNPDKPGLADYLVFTVKYVCILAPFGFYAMSGHRFGDFAIALLVPFLEEQARVTWVHNAKDPWRAAMVFGVLIAVSELLLLGRISGGFASLDGFQQMIAARWLPSILHLVDSLIVFYLLRMKVNVVLVWLGVSSVHLVYNEFLADPFTDFMESL